MLKRRRNPLGRAFSIIGAMVEAPDRAWGVREIARDLKMHHSTAHRVLGLLEQEGFIEQDADTGRYRLGLELFRIAWIATSAHPIRNAALPALQDLVAETNETALLGLWDATSARMMFAASIESAQPLRYVIETNRWVPVHLGATGVAILAFLPADEQERVIQLAYGEADADDTVELRRSLVETRQRGYAVTRGQRIEGAVGIAAPFFAADGRVHGDVAVTMPDQRFVASMAPDLSAAVVRAADRITYELGGRPLTRRQDTDGVRRRKVVADTATAPAGGAQELGVAIADADAKK